MFLMHLLESELLDRGAKIVQIITWVALILGLIAVVVLCVMHDRVKFDTRTIAFGAVAIAMSFVLSFAKIPLGTYGGSITVASMLPIFIFAYVYGPVKGLLVGIIYGMLQFLQESWFCHPVQLLLDYPLAFGMVALSGAFKKVCNNKPAGIFLGLIAFCLGRLLMHFFSGIIIVNVSGWIVEDLPLFGNIFEQYGAYLYSLVYNALYMVPETVILCVVVGILVATKGFTTLQNAMLKQRD